MAEIDEVDVAIGLSDAKPSTVRPPSAGGRTAEAQATTSGATMPAASAPQATIYRAVGPKTKR